VRRCAPPSRQHASMPACMHVCALLHACARLAAERCMAPNSPKHSITLAPCTATWLLNDAAVPASTREPAAVVPPEADTGGAVLPVLQRGRAQQCAHLALGRVHRHVPEPEAAEDVPARVQAPELSMPWPIEQQPSELGELGAVVTLSIQIPHTRCIRSLHERIKTAKRKVHRQTLCQVQDNPGVVYPSRPRRLQL